MNERDDVRRGEFRASRVFNAPITMVYQAFIEPEQLAVFWGGPDVTVPVESISMDVRPGGMFKLTMVAEDGTEYPNRGEYLEIVENERIVFFEPDMGITATITFTDHGGRTEVDIYQTGVPEQYRGPEAEAGFAATFDKLPAHLQELLDLQQAE